MRRQELEELTLATLRKWCRNRGIAPEGKKKTEIIALLLPLLPSDAETVTSESAVAGGPEMVQGPPTNPTRDRVGEVFKQRLELFSEELTVAEKMELMRMVQEEVARERSDLGEHGRLSVSSVESRARDILKLATAFPTFQEGQDSIDAFLETFEIMCRTHNITEEDWPRILSGKLTGRASATFRALSDEQRLDYEEIKQALLIRYAITPEFYRQTFRSLLKTTQDTYLEFGNKLSRALDQWIKGTGAETMEDLRQLCLKEQFLERCPLGVREWIMDREPQTVEEAAQLADKYTETRTPTKRATQAQSTTGAKAREYPGSQQRSSITTSTPRQLLPGAGPKTCFGCGAPGHFQATCPLNRRAASPSGPPKLTPARPVATIRKESTECDPAQIYLSETPEFAVMQIHWADQSKRRCHVVPVDVDGNRVEGFLDSGAFITLAEPHVITLNRIVPGKMARVILAGGQRREVPIAQVTLDWGEGPVLHEVGVMDQLPADVLLGNDVGDICCSITRRQAELGEPPAVVQEVSRQTDVTGDHFDIGNWQDFRAEQAADPTLQTLRDRTVPGLEGPNAGEQIVQENGLYYRVLKNSRGRQREACRQLLVPAKFRTQLLHLAHEVPLAGHQGISRTRYRLLQNFYWPGVSQQVAQFCRSCDSCQRVGKSGDRNKHTLRPLPVIGEPFQRVAVDLVGPLSRPSRTGKQYILTVVDYATRYPEAVALKKIDAPAVADALIQIFTRVGFPSEILSDQGPQFMSQLLQCLWQRCGVTSLRSTPYHPQTNGLCERFNGTLKNMLRTFVEDGEGDWEKFLPCLLFAYREVPQESTGFSPFELLYGRRVRGPLDLLREYWEGGAQFPDFPVVPYVLQFRKRLEQMTALVKEHLSEALTKQKVWYDRNARDRHFVPGDKVLLLIPMRSDKLKAAWEGPYVVVQAIHDTTYVVSPIDNQDQYKTVHVNMMKQYVEREATVSAICSLLEEGRNEEAFPDLLQEAMGVKTWEDVTISEQLTPEKYEQLCQLLQKFQSQFSERPGCTNWVVHQVNTEGHGPIRTPAYRVAESVRAAMKKEIEEMLALGVIVPSQSPWASPVVLVPKKDGSTRFCVDYRKLNQVTVTDAYPMPRVDELLDRLGNAKYLTTLDLSRGYWQIPLAPEDQEKSAFITPYGLFHFTVMPFGMKNAPATFQRVANQLLEGYQEFAQAYLDDIAVFSNTWEEHVQHLQSVLGRIMQAGLTLKPGKCHFGMAEVQYLGHRVGSGRVMPEPAKVEAIVNWPTPTTQRQVLAFLGTAGY
ncbi:uncharacterized protein LOC121399407 [Xenopus laevis]|uniref:Gypsy retrotransposon integrase-like protein 1 n=1 Tax=Xenopus laevis TaxID=8355 RepID=A0A8J1M2P7_XENLA|nr:uncharacterized protein LOC121399407 [Xenopus laevis]